MTADERPGWAYRFARRGYPVIVPDWPGHGRSGSLNLDTLTGEMVCQGLASMIADLPGPVVLVNHSMGAALGWRIAEICGDQVTAIIGVAPGPPGNIQPAPEIISENNDRALLRQNPRKIKRMKQIGLTMFRVVRLLDPRLFDALHHAHCVLCRLSCGNLRVGDRCTDADGLTKKKLDLKHRDDQSDSELAPTPFTRAMGNCATPTPAHVLIMPPPSLPPLSTV
jgi:pimeloyl-ACP methyl ester carboxylesterase